MHSQDGYWGVAPVSAVAPIEESAERNDTAIFDPVMHDPRAPDYKITPAAFWNMTSKNPNKTVRDYNEKFDHNMPVPVVKDEQIVYSFEGPQIYFNLLNQIIRMDEKVHYDHPDFLKLVVDHVQLFERHWRKMVADIRNGKLDRNLHISEESRLIFESANIPRPQLATRLDNTFRNLGFHMKVLGKDIQIRPYAKKKKVGMFAQPPPRRKRSLPTNALAAVITTNNTGTMGGSKPLSSSTKLPAIGHASFSDTEHVPSEGARARFALDDVATRTRTVIRPNQLTRASSNPLLSAAASAIAAVKATTDSTALTKFDPNAVPSHSAAKRAMLEEMGQTSAVIQRKEAARRTESPSPVKKPQTKRELLASLGRTFQAVSAATAADNRPVSRAVSAASEDTAAGAGGTGSRPGTKDSSSTTPTRKRRGSHSDSQSRPITAHDLDAVHYSLDTAARDNYKHTIKTDGDRFVCPFPACGKSFHSMDAAFRHLPVHEQRTRLYAPTPLPDSHLGFYWPEGVPWLENDRYAERAIPPGALACTVPGCKGVFSAQMHFEAHLRNAHGIVGNSSATHGFFVMKGEASYVPPDRPPPYVPLHWCPMHSLPLGSCSTCVRIDSSKGPKQPFRFYPAVEINFRLRRQLKLHVPNTVAHAESADRHSAILEYSDAHTGVVVVHKTVKVAAAPALESPTKPSRHNSILSTGPSTGGSSRSLTRLRRQTNSLHTTAAPSSHIAHEWRGRPVAMMTDRNDNGWVAVEVLYTHAEAAQKGLSIPTEFNKRHQLLRPLRPYISVDPDGNVDLAELEIYDTAAIDDFERFIRWVPIHTIDRTFSLTLCESQEEVDEILRNSPPTALKNKFFVSHSDVDY